MFTVSSLLESSPANSCKDSGTTKRFKEHGTRSPWQQHSFVGLEEPKRAPTFAAALKEFLVWSEHQHAARPSTHHRYEVSSKPLKRFFGATPLDRITPETVEKFKTWRAGKKSDYTGRRLRPATINRELACLKILFNRFEDTVPKNPVRKVKFL